MPYKGSYTVDEFWQELSQGTLWKQYAKANPGEAAELQKHIERKIARQADFVPAGFTKTHTGTAILMAVLTMQAPA